MATVGNSGCDGREAHRDAVLVNEVPRRTGYPFGGETPGAKWLGASSRTDPFRDELADVFGVRRDRDDRAGKHVDDILRRLPSGKVLCIVRLLDIAETDGMFREALPARERVFGNYEDGRYAWLLEMVEVFEPAIPSKGNRMLWEWNRDASRTGA